MPCIVIYLEKGYPIERLHGGLDQKERFETMKNFKIGRFAYLVSTDVAARGIDVSGVSHVINYDLPPEKDSFVHRIGRAGRAGQKGKAITFATRFDQRWLEEIQAYIGFELPICERPSAGCDATSERWVYEKIKFTSDLTS